MPHNYTYFIFTQAHLEWLKKQLIWVDSELAQLEERYSDCGFNFHVAGMGSNIAHDQGYVYMQRTLDKMAEDLKIPLEAVPKVKSCWDALRRRQGKGMVSNLTIFQL